MGSMPAGDWIQEIKFEKMDFATSAEMIRQAVRWVETLRLDEK
jgi:hypothetical protein